MSEIRRWLLALFTHPCRACSAPIWLGADLCEPCVDRLPVEDMWAYRSAREWRLLHRDAYRTSLYGPHGDDGALAWLATNPRCEAATTTKATTKERS